MTSKPRQELQFVVRETVCPRAQDPPASECDFKDNGVSVPPLNTQLL